MANSPGRFPVSASELAKGLTLEVQITGVRQWSWRLRVALWLIRIATRIAGIGFRFVEFHEGE